MRKFKWIRNAGAGCLALTAMLATGCSSTTGIRATEPVTTITPPTPVYASPEQVQRTLNFNVTAKGTDAGASTVATAVEQDIKGRLTGLGYRMDAGSPDVIVTLTAQSSQFDKSGNYYRHDGILNAEIRMQTQTDQIGSQRFTARSDRKLGEDESLRDLASRLSTPAGEWLAAQATPLSQRFLSTDISIHRTLLARAGLTDGPEYAARFVRVVSALPGVIRCEIIEQDQKRTRMTFRVLYGRDAFPETLVNHLLNISELNLKP